MSIWSCVSPARCSQPAVAGGFIYADLRSELNTYLAPQALFTQCSPGHNYHCYKLSPFQAHWGRWRYTRLLHPACLFTVHVGNGSSPLSCGVFLPPPLLQAFLLQGYWAGAATPAFSSQLVYLQFCEALSPSSALRAPHPLCYVSFCCCCLLFSLVFFSLFSLGGGRSVQGAMLIWPKVVCGSTACRLAHLVVCIFPSHLGAGICWCGSPPGFSI
jgi:hypothetical protein